MDSSRVHRPHRGVDSKEHMEAKTITKATRVQPLAGLFSDQPFQTNSTMVGGQLDARVSEWAVMGRQLLGAGLVVSGSPPNYLEMYEGAIVAGKLYWTDQTLHTTRFIPSYVARFSTPGEQRTEVKEAVIRVATIEVVQDETEKTLDRIRSLPFDWNGQGSEPPNSLSLSIAAGVLSLLRQRQMKPGHTG